MPRPSQPLCALPWTPDLVAVLGAACQAIGALDARISASCVAPAWRQRASWAGYAAALRLQRFEIDEIDVISQFTGITIPGRPPIATAREPFVAFADWTTRLRETGDRHWLEDVPFTFDPPAEWDHAPPLVRALALQDLWSRADPSAAPWLALPVLLQRMDITRTALPCLVVGDPSQRTLHGPRAAQLKRLLKGMARSAKEGLLRFERLEDTRLRWSAAVAESRRPGNLAALGVLIMRQPVLAARSIVNPLGLTLSGAGKLLARAAEKHLLIEASGRSSWKLYASPDVGTALGIIRPRLGRPMAAPRASPALDAILSQFDREMKTIDRMIS